MPPFLRVRNTLRGYASPGSQFLACHPQRPAPLHHPPTDVCQPQFFAQHALTSICLVLIISIFSGKRNRVLLKRINNTRFTACPDTQKQGIAGDKNPVGRRGTIGRRLSSLTRRESAFSQTPHIPAIQPWSRGARPTTRHLRRNWVQGVSPGVRGPCAGSPASGDSADFQKCRGACPLPVRDPRP